MVVDQVVESDATVALFGYFKGTHTGDLQGAAGTIPASGASLNLRFGGCFEVSDGRIVSQQEYFDQMDLLGQLGALPAP